MKEKVYNRCVMDNISDDTIKFKSDGTCNYCNEALDRRDQVYFPNEIGKQKLDSMIKIIKEDGKGKRFDCLMGLSGGLDSTYLAYLGAKEWDMTL